MTSRAPVECPICHRGMDPDQRLLEHLLSDHTKRELARFTAIEAQVLEDEDISE